MTIQKRGNTYWIDVTIRGERVRQTLKTSDQREAKARAKELERALWEGTFIEKDSCAQGRTLKQAFDDLYVLHWSDTKDKLGVVGRFDTLCKFISPDTSVASIGRDQIDTLIAAMKRATYTRSPAPDAQQYKYSNATINRVLALLSFILRSMEDKGLIDKAPRIKKAAEQQRTRYLTEVEEEEMFYALAASKVGSHRRCLSLFEFLIDTGCRLSEALNLQWRDINDESRTVTLRNTKSGHDVVKPLTARAWFAIEASDYSTCSSKTGPFVDLTEAVIRRAWDYAKNQAGLGDDDSLVRHSLRHTYASRLVQRGIDTTIVQDLLGHRSALTTRRYAHLAIEHKTAAIAVLERGETCVQSVQSKCELTEGSGSGIVRNSLIQQANFSSPIAQSVERRTVNPYKTVRGQTNTPTESTS